MSIAANRITGADVHLADDIVLNLTNDEPAYRHVLYLRTSLARKVKRGIYDPVLAGRAWRYMVENYLTTYKRESGVTGRIDVPTRNLAGRLLEQNQREHVYSEAGITEPLFPVADAEIRAIEAEAV